MLTSHPLLTEKQVARLLGVSVAAVRKWRLQQRGPLYRKLGSSVRYKSEDVSAWVDSTPKGGGALVSQTGRQQ